MREQIEGALLVSRPQDYKGKKRDTFTETWEHIHRCLTVSVTNIEACKR